MSEAQSNTLAKCPLVYFAARATVYFSLMFCGKLVDMGALDTFVYARFAR